MLKHRITISLPLLLAVLLTSFCGECIPVAPVEKPAGFINTESYKDSRISEMGTVCLAEKSCGPAGGNDNSIIALFPTVVVDYVAFSL